MARVKTVRFQRSGSVLQSLVPFSNATRTIYYPRAVNEWGGEKKKKGILVLTQRRKWDVDIFHDAAPLNRVITRSGALRKRILTFPSTVPHTSGLLRCLRIIFQREIPLNFRTSAADWPSAVAALLHFPSSCTFIYYYPRNFVSYEWHSAKFSKDTAETRSK